MPADSSPQIGAHHCTPEAVDALLTDLDAIGECRETPPLCDRDHRARAGVIACVIRHLMVCNKATRQEHGTIASAGRAELPNTPANSAHERDSQPRPVSSKEQIYVAALRESREYLLDNGDERTMAPLLARIDDALLGTADVKAPAETDHCILAMSYALELLREKEPDGCKCGAFLRPIIAQLERSIADRRADREPPPVETNGNQADAEATAYSAPSAGGMLPNNPARTDSRGFRLSSLGHPIEAICGSCSTPLITHDDESFMHDCDCMHSPVKSNWDPCPKCGAPDHTKCPCSRQEQWDAATPAPMRLPQ